jgi:hypothetical protein
MRKYNKDLDELPGLKDPQAAFVRSCMEDKWQKAIAGKDTNAIAETLKLIEGFRAYNDRISQKED